MFGIATIFSFGVGSVTGVVVPAVIKWIKNQVASEVAAAKKDVNNVATDVKKNIDVAKADIAIAKAEVANTVSEVEKKI